MTVDNVLWQHSVTVFSKLLMQSRFFLVHISLIFLPSAHHKLCNMGLWVHIVYAIWFDVGGSAEQAKDPDNDQEINEVSKLSGEEKPAHYDDHLTPAERRYIEQREQLDVHRLAKISNKSHRDRIQDFNQYLANMSEHYDIPKVGPGWFNEVYITSMKDQSLSFVFVSLILMPYACTMVVFTVYRIFFVLD